jgi:hypothetical protein
MPRSRYLARPSSLRALAGVSPCGDVRRRDLVSIVTTPRGTWASRQSLASMTLRARPLKSYPLNRRIAASASPPDAISTNPKPRECPVSRLRRILADLQIPTPENSRCRSLLVADHGRFPT